jgi:hypothetical protein
LFGGSQHQVKCRASQPETSQQRAAETENQPTAHSSAVKAPLVLAAGTAAGSSFANGSTLGGPSASAIQDPTPPAATVQAEEPSLTARVAAVAAAEAPTAPRVQATPLAEHDPDEEAYEDEEEASVHYGVSDGAASILNPVMIDMLNDDKLTGLLVEILGHRDEPQAGGNNRDSPSKVGQALVTLLASK